MNKQRNIIIFIVLLVLNSVLSPALPLSSFLSSVYAQTSSPLTAKSLRLGAIEEHTRVVVEFTEAVDYKLFTLSSPYRAVIDLPETKWDIPDTIQDKGLVSGVRFGSFKPGQGRIVVDLRGPVNVHKHFLLPPTVAIKNHRLVIDFEPATIATFRQMKPAISQTQTASISAPDFQPTPTPQPQFSLPTGEFTPKPRPRKTRKIIVIDPGHGGVDPGALGTRSREKDIVLAFSKELVRQLKATRRYDVYLTRSSDIYIPLRQRVQIARNRNADLFISIHADAIKKKNIRGLSVYTLSEKASDREAAALAKKENQSDIIAGVDFGDQLPEVTNILIDLAQRDTKNASVKFAESLISSARGKTLLLDRTHRFAGFRVLKAPDVPSVLVELGFITNRTDEKQLSSSKWRRRVATGMVEAIDNYFRLK
ncbi:Colicin V production protein [Candidatus Micropelagos thuwalensis]|uniref:N-acetylmuramoyl-L-alanine amidase n=1 Tax=Candidatus Micropelagius thuwalensis TaxID=1397666 RepID=U2XQZ1_9PROT|nr:N-acetylmuramoyl-L-alanine amidase [Candidatus Micropelagos thuwalensis]ERL47542.1 Colicin V production protein [Candidatus Micropelagos thuwalensis]